MWNPPQLSPAERLRILFVCAGPNDTARMRLEEEIREITTWLNSGPFRDLLSIELVLAARQNDLRHALLRHNPHILHFSGHGSESGILLEDNSGKASVFEFEQLGQLLTAFHDNLHLVVLNACNSAHRANAILQPVDYVIGMNHKILDRSAINFASAFYLSIGFNRTIRECFLSGLAALRTSGTPQAHIPVLLSNEGRDPHRTNPLSWVTSQKGEEKRQEKTAAVSDLENITGAIQLDILLLPPNTNKARRWRYASNQTEESFESIDERQERLPAESMWQFLAAETNNLTKAFRGARMTPPDIFLILHDDLLLSLYPEQILENIIRKVCLAARGSNVYLACDREVPFNSIYTRKKYQADLERWFQTLVMFGVTDVIEIPRGQEATDPETLRKYANNSQDRRQRLRKLVSAEDWAIELRPQALTLKLFLERFTEGDVGLINAKNLAVFYDLKPNNGVRELLENARKRNCAGKWFIAAHTGSKIDIGDLEERWKKEASKKGPEWFDEIFEFHGMVEWLYAICRLHLAAQLARLTSPNVAAKAMF